MNKITIDAMSDRLLTYMRFIGSDKSKTGEEKKRWVLSELEKDMELDPNVERVIINMIDLLIDVDKGSVKINPKIRKLCCW